MWWHAACSFGHKLRLSCLNSRNGWLFPVFCGSGTGAVKTRRRKEAAGVRALENRGRHGPILDLPLTAAIPTGGSEWRRSNRETETWWRTRIDPQIAPLSVSNGTCRTFLRRTSRFGDPRYSTLYGCHEGGNPERSVRREQPSRLDDWWRHGPNAHTATLLLARKARARAMRTPRELARENEKVQQSRFLTMCARTVSTRITLDRNVWRRDTKYRMDSSLSVSSLCSSWPLTHRQTGRTSSSNLVDFITTDIETLWTDLVACPSIFVFLWSPALFGSFCHCDGSPSETIAPCQLAVVFRAWPFCPWNPHELTLEALRGSREPTLSSSLILNSNGQIYTSLSDPRPPADSKGVLLVGRAWRKQSWTGPADCALASAKLDEALERPRNSTMNGWSCMRQPGKTCTTCQQPSRAYDRWRHGPMNIDATDGQKGKGTSKDTPRELAQEKEKVQNSRFTTMCASTVSTTVTEKKNMAQSHE